MKSREKEIAEHLRAAKECDERGYPESARWHREMADSLRPRVHHRPLPPRRIAPVNAAHKPTNVIGGRRG